MQSIPTGNNFGPGDLVLQHRLDAMNTKRDFVMSSRTDICEQIDCNTSRSICNAVGERLRQDLRPVESELPCHLERLMDELRRQDAGDRRMPSN